MIREKTTANSGTYTEFEVRNSVSVPRIPRIRIQKDARLKFHEDLQFFPGRIFFARRNVMNRIHIGILVIALFLALCPTVHAGSNNVVITKDSDFLTCGCVSGGSGTQADPHLISGLTIFTDSAAGILVDNTYGNIKEYFDITGVTIQGSGTTPSSFPGVEFIKLNGLGAITGSLNTFNGNKYGIQLEDSSNILVDGATGSTVNNNGVAGILINGGGSNTISNLTVNHNGIGIPEDFFNGGVGIKLTSTTGNIVTNVVLSEDAFSGLVLSSSSSNIINGISVHYPDFYGVVIDGGFGNTIQNSTLQTADYVALWLRHGTSGNTVVANFFSGNGPTGKEKTDGIAPYFSTAVYLSSGASGNKIENNVFGSTGGGNIIQDDGGILNVITHPLQVNNPFNDPVTGNEPSSPLPPSGKAGLNNTFCGTGKVVTQGVLMYPPC
jgi:hypothetical protein